MLQEECHGPDGPEFPPGSSGIQAPVKFPLSLFGGGGGEVNPP